MKKNFTDARIVFVRGAGLGVEIPALERAVLQALDVIGAGEIADGVLAVIPPLP